MSLLRWSPPRVVSKPSAKSASSKSSSAVEDLLDAVIAPRTYTKDDGSLFLQRISSEPATKTDVVRLQEALDQLLQQRQARETGICPLREALYAETFDEIIRQVAINAAERGVLLLRVRDELRMVMKTYQTLYESSIAFGMRKALMAEQKRGELQAKIKLSRAEIAELEGSVESLTTKLDAFEAAEKEKSAAEEAKHAAEVEKLQAANATLKEELEAMLAPPRK